MKAQRTRARSRVQTLVATFTFLAVLGGVAPAVAQENNTIANANSLAELVEAIDYQPDLHGEILRLYPAFFAREADLDGARYWIDVANSRRSVTEITSFFSSNEQPEFVKFYEDIAPHDHEAYLTRVYRNMLGRTPDPDGFNYWLGLMQDRTLDRGGVVRFVALNPEYVRRFPYLPVGEPQDPGPDPDPPPVDPPPPAETPPNILVIMTDDQRRDSLVAMPNVMRWMGEQGTQFTEGYVTTPSCCPARAATLTGRYNHNNGVVTQDGPPFNEDTSIAKYLGDAGYATAHIGKYVHYYDLNERAPHWDRWTYYEGGYDNVNMNVEGVVSQSNGYATQIAFDRAIEYADEFETNDPNQPWLIHVWPTAPHRIGNNPPSVEAKFQGSAVPPFVIEPRTFEADLSDKPPFMYCCPNQTTPAYIENVRDEMIRALYSVDDGVDRLLNHLEQQGELDNTLVFFLSDNGWMFGDHQLHEKFVPYENSVGVPFLLRWPGKVAENAISDRFVSNIDVLPTALAAADVAIPGIVDGQDILSAPPRDRRLTEYFRDTSNIQQVTDWGAIATSEHQYIRWDQTDGSIKFEEFYDRIADPFQLVNLLGDADPTNDPDPALLNSLRAQLAADRACSGSSCP